MWLEKLELVNVRCFDHATFEFARGINLLVGPNNSGKSTVLLPILALQEGLVSMQPSDVRLGETSARASFSFHDFRPQYFRSDKVENVCLEYNVARHGAFVLLAKQPGSSDNVIIRSIPEHEPDNFIYPFISKRKVASLADTVNNEAATKILPNFENLNAKIDRLSNPEFLPAHTLYMRACDEILGFRVTAAHTRTGKHAVYTVRNMSNIPLLSMGEGVMNMLGLVVHLAMAQNHLFVIEEPENDVHPRALKALLGLIAEKAVNNQFLITTHSNIVLKSLGAVSDARIYSVNASFADRMPTSHVRDVGTSPESRREILAELGYELNDLDLWDAWLILEESSAEKIIRQYLIPWFCPSLCGRLRTVSAHSLSEVIPRFRDFDNLFVYLHLTPTYRNRAWVVVDGGNQEAQIIEQLRSAYAKSGWKADRFIQFKSHDFERYYPTVFEDRVAKVLSLPDKDARREKKAELLTEVEQWISQDAKSAKEAFAQSASEVIELLRTIQSSL